MYTQLPLRERKKQLQKAALQHHALRLFKRQGYDKTTIEQITAAAEVSAGTFFNYFAAKADVVLFNGIDEAFYESFIMQPKSLDTVQALRASMRHVFGSLSLMELHNEERRLDLIRVTPELRNALIARMSSGIQGIAVRMLARRPDSEPSEARLLAGAVVGVGIATFLDPAPIAMGERLIRFDVALTRLDQGFGRSAMATSHFKRLQQINNKEQL